MSTLITDGCIGCGVCEGECPNEAISEDAVQFVIDSARCTECVGFHPVEQCAAVCPVACCVPDPDRVEGEAALFARAKKLHPRIAEELELGPENSRFRRS